MSAALSLIQLHSDISARRDTNIIEYVMEMNSTSKLFFFLILSCLINNFKVNNSYECILMFINL